MRSFKSLVFLFIFATSTIGSGSFADVLAKRASEKLAQQDAHEDACEDAGGGAGGGN